MVAVTPLPKLPAAALGVINVHGQVIPILDIRHRLGFPPKAYGLETHLLVARTTRRTVALPVDEVLGVREIQAAAVTPPETVLPGINHVAGIVTLSDDLLFIHDLNTFFSLDEEQQVGSALGEMAR
jgi:purine-binding chemotaxis protein CheW